MRVSEETISVLLPVHAGVEAEYLEAAVDSVVAQTRPADEIVVVEDGPLLAGQLTVLDRLEQRHPAVVRIRLPENRGAGVANQAGLLRATGDWIAKVDADDVSVSHRFQTQVRAATASGLDVCGAAMLEFDEDLTRPVALRRNPLTHEAIARRMRFNNPINHPTAFFRRAPAVACGGYPDLRLMQDYVLFARLLQAGAVMRNLEEPLVHFRAGAGVHARRSGAGFGRLEWRVQRELRQIGLVGRARSLLNLTVRVLYRRLPGAPRRWVHGNVLARAVGERP